MDPSARTSSLPATWGLLRDSFFIIDNFGLETMLICGTDKSLPSVPISKGCITCVARKTRCDGRRPTCLACQDRKQVCRGYRRQNFVFMNDGWRAPGVATGQANKRKKKKATPVPDTTPARALALNRSDLHVAFFLSQFATHILGSSSFMGEIFAYYFALPPCRTSSNSEVSVVVSAKPVVLAVEALAQGYFGRANADMKSVQQSFRKYGLALQSMSTKLHELQLDASDFQSLSEDDWQHMAFFCIVMAFWELKMSPDSRNWQKHISGLATAIVLRGTGHAYSQTNIKLLAMSRLFIILQTLSSRQPNVLLTHDWLRSSPIRSAWRSETRPFMVHQKNALSTTDHSLYASLDALMTDITPLVDVMVQYDQLLDRTPSIYSICDDDASSALARLYNETEAILYRVEASHAVWDMTTSEVSLEEWAARHEGIAADSINLDFKLLFDKALTFGSMGEYHGVALYWTTAMTLHTFMADMIGLMIEVNCPSIPSDHVARMELHRTQLMMYTEKALRTIGFASMKDNRGVAPFFMATAFQMAIVALERECLILDARGNEQVGIERCIATKRLAERYLDWAMESKIPIRLDLRPRQ